MNGFDELAEEAAAYSQSLRASAEGGEEVAVNIEFADDFPFAKTGRRRFQTLFRGEQQDSADRC